MSEAPGQIVVFSLDKRYYGLALSAVERVVRMVDVTPLPQAPALVFGVINVQGRIIPVVNPRRRFRLPERNFALSDQLIIAHTVRRTIAFVVDVVIDVLEYSLEEVVGAHDIVPGIEYVEGVVKLADGLVLIHDLDKFLSMEEGVALDLAIEGA
jgi:purine-binding chemotaxis protein CheW